MKIATLRLGTIDINKFDSDGSFSPEMNRPNFGMFGSTLIKTKYNLIKFPLILRKNSGGNVH